MAAPVVTRQAWAPAVPAAPVGSGRPWTASSHLVPAPTAPRPAPAARAVPVVPAARPPTEPVVPAATPATAVMPGWPAPVVSATAVAVRTRPATGVTAATAPTAGWRAPQAAAAPASTARAAIR